MVKKYKFRTSLGEVVVSFDEDKIMPDKLYSVEVKIESGEEFIENLYVTEGAGHGIKKMNDGSLWIDIYLSDGFYGSPEYLLEEVK